MQKEKVTPGWFECTKCSERVYFIKEEQLVYVDMNIFQVRCSGCGYVETFSVEDE